MILNTPIVDNVPAFDPNYSYTFTFSYSGNQVVKNRIVITDNENLNVIYDNIQNGLRLSHDLPAGTLLVGKSYLVQIQVYDIDNNSSSLSDPILFYCYSTPQFIFQNIQNNMTISSASLDLILSYSQSESETLQQYQYYVYEYDKSVIYYSDVYYTLDNLTHTINNLKNDTSYYVRAIGKTLHGMELDTGYILINIQYYTTPANMVLTVMNSKPNGYLTYYTGIKTVGYIVDDPDGYTITNSTVDLTNNKLTYNEGFNIKEDFTVIIKAKVLPLNSNFFTMTSEGTHYEIALNLVNINNVIYCKLVSKYGDSDYSLYRDIQSTKYTTSTSYLNFINTLIITLKRKSGLFELELAFEEEA